MAETVYLSLGSNLGDREQNLRLAIRLISEMEGFELLDRSPLYVNPAVDMGADAPDFLNMAIRGEYRYSALELLTNIENIEKRLGRTGKGRSRPRTIDIDIVFFGDRVIEHERLAVPHPRLTKRPFVIAPILYIDPELIHPRTGKKLSSYIKPKALDSLVVYKERIGTGV